MSTNVNNAGLSQQAPNRFWCRRAFEVTELKSGIVRIETAAGRTPLPRASESTELWEWTVA